MNEEQEESDLLDIPCAGDIDCAWSEGGDSLLDSEDDVEESQCLQAPHQCPSSSQPPDIQCSSPSHLPDIQCSSPSHLPDVQCSSTQDEKCSKALSDLPSSNPHSTTCQETTLPPHSDVGNTVRSKVIRLDGQRKFRCVSDSLPEVPLRKKTVFHRKTVFGKPRRLTKPSLLLEPKRLLIKEPHIDLRNTLVANRTIQLKHRLTCGLGRENGRGNTGAVGNSLTTDQWSSKARTVSLSPFVQSTANCLQEETAEAESLCSADNTDSKSSKNANGLFDNGISSVPISFPQLFPPTSSAGLPPSLPQLFPPTSSAGLPPSLPQLFPPTSSAGLPPSLPPLFPPTSSAGLPPSLPPLQHTPAHNTGHINPFYEKMQELPFSSTEDSFNPFFTALQREEQQADFTDDQAPSHTFSFSLAQITS